MHTHAASIWKRWYGGMGMFYVPSQHLVGKMRERQRKTSSRERERRSEGWKTRCAHMILMYHAVLIHPYAALEPPSPAESGKTLVTYTHEFSQAGLLRRSSCTCDCRFLSQCFYACKYFFTSVCFYDLVCLCKAY